MHSALEIRRKRKDKERKSALVPCSCHLYKGRLCSAKKARQHKTIFKRNWHAGIEYFEENSDKSSNSSSNQQSPIRVFEYSSGDPDDNDNSISPSNHQQSPISNTGVESFRESSDDTSPSNEQSSFEMEEEFSGKEQEEAEHDYNSIDFESTTMSSDEMIQ